jgi:polysaccharide export outer membrane protein
VERDITVIIIPRRRIRRSTAFPCSLLGRRLFLLTCLVVSISSPLIAQQAPSSQIPTTLFSSQAPGDNEATIEPGDLLNLVVFDTPEFSGPVRVSNIGNLDVPLIGRVHVAGLSLLDASSLIRNQLIKGNFLKDPQVVLSFSDFSNHYVVLLGEVQKPGVIPVSGTVSLWEVVGAAGGPLPTAGDRVSIVHRGESKPSTYYKVDWSRDLSGQPNPALRPGDTVQISRAGMVYVTGQVGRPGAFPISHQQLTVSQAIVLAQGIQYSARASQTRLIRVSDSGRTVTQIDILRIIKGQSPDIALQDNDILYIPNSTAKVAITKGIQAAIAISTQLIIFKNE